MSEIKNILVVDDEKEINETLTEIFTNRGFKVFLL